MSKGKWSSLVRRGRSLLPHAVVVCGLMGSNSVSGSADDYVVIVNKVNPVDSIHSADLRRMFTGEKTSWPDGGKVIPITPGPDRPEYGPAIKKATGMSGADFKRYFIELSFLGKTVSQPRTLDTPTAIARFVSVSPGAVSCVPAAEAGASVKVLKVH